MALKKVSLSAIKEENLSPNMIAVHYKKEVAYLLTRNGYYFITDNKEGNCYTDASGKAYDSKHKAILRLRELWYRSEYQGQYTSPPNDVKATVYNESENIFQVRWNNHIGYIKRQWSLYKINGDYWWEWVFTDKDGNADATRWSSIYMFYWSKPDALWSMWNEWSYWKRR